MSSRAVEEAVETAGGDVAQRQRGRTERAELAPRRLVRRHPDDRDHRALDRGDLGRREALAVEPRALAAHRGVPRAGGAVLDEARTAGRRRRARTARSPQYGMPREQFVDPSTGSTTTVISASSGPVHPDSSLSTRTGRAASTGRTAASATVSRWYWPMRSVRARRSIPVSPASAARCASAASAKHVEQVVGRHVPAPR